MTNKWERLKTETSVAYEAFCVYRDMGVNRGIHAVSKNLSKSIPLIKRWSSQHNWVERASAYDDYLEQKERKKLERQRFKQRQNRIKIMTHYQMKLVDAIQHLDPQSANWKDVTAGLQMVARELRAEFGEDKPEIEINNNIEIGADTSRAELFERLKRLQDD